MMPILPLIEDTPYNITQIVQAAVEHGAVFIIPAFGMNIREGQREHYFMKLDDHFLGLHAKYEASFGDSYLCPARNQTELRQLFYER